MKKQAVIALALCTACAAWMAGCGKEEVAEEKSLRSVETSIVGTSAISSDFSYTGKAAPSKQVSVVPTVAGKVVDFNYEVGDTVGQGAVLFTVDSTDLLNNMRSLEASYKVAELGYQNAKATYESNSVLYEEGIIAQTDFDQIKYSYESAQAQLESIQVQMDTLQKNINDCAVTSPMRGVVSQRNVERGSFASQAVTAYTVMDLSVIKVEVGVSEQVVNTIHVGDTVSVMMTAVSAEPLAGKVSTIAPAADQSGTYTVKIEMDNSENAIKSGMMAEVNFTMESAEDAIVLPRNAVIEKDGETYVYIVADGKAKKVDVVPGIESADTIEITEGLTAGDAVITKGQTYVSDGEEVKILNEAAEENADAAAEKETPAADAETPDETPEKGE